MTDDREITATLKLKQDQAATEATKKALKTVFSELQSIEKEALAIKNAKIFDELTKDAIKFAKETDDASEAVKQLTKNLIEAGATADDLELASKQFASGLKAPEQPQASGGGGLGKAGAAQAIGVGLGGEAGGAISSIAAGAATLGPVGAAAAAATVGLSLAMGVLTKRQEEAAKAITLHNDLVEDRIDLEKLTSAELEKLNDQRQQEIDDLRQRISEAAGVDEAELTSGGLDNFAENLEATLFNIGDTLGVVGAEGDRADEELQQMVDDLARAEGELANVNDVLGSTEVAANDAAAALEELNRQMADELLDAAGDAGEAVRNETAALGRSRDANIKRLEAIEQERRAIQAELDVLNAQGSESEEVRKKIEALTNQLGDLGAESEIVTQIANQQSAAAKRANKATKGFTITTSGFAKAVDRAKDKQNEMIKEVENFWNDMLDLEFKAAQDREKIAIDANRAQAELLRKSKQDFDQDFFQDFLGEFTNRTQLAFDLQETQIQAGQSFQDVNRGLATDLAQNRAESQSNIQNTNTFNFPNANPQQMLQILQQLGIT
jgi:hypothetical protein